MSEEPVTEQVIRSILADSLHISDPTPEYLNHLIHNLRLAYGINVEPVQTTPAQPLHDPNHDHHEEDMQEEVQKKPSAPSYILPRTQQRNRLSGGLKKTDCVGRHRAYEEEWSHVRRYRRRKDKDQDWEAQCRMSRPQFIMRHTDPVASHQDLDEYWRGDRFLDEKRYAKARSSLAWETRCQLLCKPSQKASFRGASQSGSSPERWSQGTNY